MKRKIAGIILIITGLVLFFGLIATVIIADYRHWALNLEGFQGKYSSFVDMLYSREKGAFLISVLFGLFPISIGTILVQIGNHH